MGKKVLLCIWDNGFLMRKPAAPLVGGDRCPCSSTAGSLQYYYPFSMCRKYLVPLFSAQIIFPLHLTQ